MRRSQLSNRVMLILAFILPSCSPQEHFYERGEIVVISLDDAESPLEVYRQEPLLGGPEAHRGFIQSGDQVRIVSSGDREEINDSGLMASGFTVKVLTPSPTGKVDNRGLICGISRKYIRSLKE